MVNPFYQHQVLNNPNYNKTLGGFDVWYAPCRHCGYDTGKSRKLDDPKCWKCGKQIQRDYSNRALKK